MGRNKIVKSSAAIYRTILKRFKGKVVIVGVGNLLKGDDGAGPFFIQQLKKKKGISVPFILIDAGEVPENYVNPIVKTKPDVIMVVDAADFGGKPGEVGIFEAKDISRIGMTTHTLSPDVFMDYLKQQTNADIFLLAVQPKSIETDTDLSEEIESSIKELTDIFCQ